MSNQEWFKSLDRSGRKHVLSILHEGRHYIDQVGLVEPHTLSSMYDYIKQYEDLHEEVKKERGVSE